VRKGFAPDADALLSDPSLFGLGESLLNGRVPGARVSLPAENDAGAAVFVIRLDYEIFPMSADVLEKLDGLAFRGAARVLQAARPGNVAPDQIALGRVEEFFVAIVGKNGEEGFLVGNLAAQRIGDAYRAGFVGADERVTLGGMRDDVIDKHASVDE